MAGKKRTKGSISSGPPNTCFATSNVSSDTLDGGRKMDKAPTRLTWVLAAGGLLGLFAAHARPSEPPTKQSEHGSTQPGPVPQSTAGVDPQQSNATLFKN